MVMASAYRALGDPTRREILRLLREGDLRAGDLAAHFQISWPSVSRHLKVLEAADLVSSRRSGGNIIYSLQSSVLEDIVAELAEMAGVGRPEPRRQSGPKGHRTRQPQGA
jgi:ArsR family transcriptional regulator, arsenate/arsenite/antimonite-responsive transcriptional repressor